MKYTIPDWGKGLNKDALASELDWGFCNDASNVRFRNGFAVRAGGIGHMTGVSIAGPVMWGDIFPNSSSTYGAFIVFVVKGSGSNYIAYAGDQVGTTTVITRYTEGVTISSITRAGTTATLTTTTNHGRSNGDTVSVWGASPSQYNGTFVISGVTATSFTYTMASDPGASASPVGLYSYNASNQAFTSDPLTLSYYSPPPQQYSGGSFNGLFILNSPIDGLYYWSGDTAIPFRKIPNSYKARVSRPFGNYIVQLAPTMAGTEYPRRVLWSTGTEPGSFPSAFDATDTNDAGYVDLADGGELVDCLPLGDTNIVYTTDGRYAMRYVGGEQKMEFVKLPGTDGLIARGAVADIPGVGHAFITSGMDAKVHSGGDCRDISTGRIGSVLRRDWANALYQLRSFVVKNPQADEVWFCVPSAPVGNISFCDQIWMWNWKDDTWGTKTLPSGGWSLTSGWSGIPGGAHSLELCYLGGTSGTITGSIGIAETDDADFNVAFDSMVERKGMDLGDRDFLKNLQRSRWNFDGTTGDTFSVQHGSHMFADATPTYQSAVTYTLGTSDYVCSRATAGRFVAVKVTWTTTNYSLQGVSKLRSCDLDVTLGGKR